MTDAGWHRFAMNLLRRGDHKVVTQADISKIEAAIKDVLGTEVEFSDVTVTRIADPAQVEMNHAHAILDQDVYEALAAVVRHADTLTDRSAEDDARVAALLLLRKAVATYKDATEASQQRSPHSHPQVEGQNWRHY